MPTLPERLATVAIPIVSTREQANIRESDCVSSWIVESFPFNIILFAFRVLFELLSAPKFTVIEPFTHLLHN